MAREFWFSPAVQRVAEGLRPWPPEGGDYAAYPDGGLIEKVGDEFYIERFGRPWWPLSDVGGLPADAVPLVPSPERGG